MWFKKKIKLDFNIILYPNNVPGLPNTILHNNVLSLFVDFCTAKYGDGAKVLKALRGVSIEWWDKIAPGPFTGNLNTVVVYNGRIYSGLNIGKECKVAWRGAFSRSALAHELLHVINYSLNNELDPYHLNKELWELEEEFNAIIRSRGF
jgi:hypothetical protein